MTITLTRDQLIGMRPCDLDERLEMFGKAGAMNAQQAFDAGFAVSDVLWVAGQLRLTNRIVIL